MNWFESARLGMFVHWGHSSARGWELSWSLVGGVFSLPYCQDIAIADYHQNAENFNPTAYNGSAAKTRSLTVVQFGYS